MQNHINDAGGRYTGGNKKGDQQLNPARGRTRWGTNHNNAKRSHGTREFNGKKKRHMNNHGKSALLRQNKLDGLGRKTSKAVNKKKRVGQYPVRRALEITAQGFEFGWGRKRKKKGSGIGRGQPKKGTKNLRRLRKASAKKKKRKKRD